MKLYKVYLVIILVFNSLEAQEFNSELDRLKNQVEIAETEKEKLIAYTALGEYLLERDILRSEQAFTNIVKITETKHGHDHSKDQYLANAYNKLGVISRRKAEYTSALSLYLKAKKLYEEIGDLSNVGDVIHNIGIVYRYQNQDLRSIQNFKQAIFINSQTKDTFSLAAAYNMMGVSYRRIGKLDSALICYNKARDLFVQLKREEDIRGVDNNIAILYYFQGHYEKSVKVKLDNLEYYKSIGNKMSTCVAYYNLSRDFDKLKEFTKSLKYADSSLAIAKQQGFKEKLSQGYRRRSAVHRKMNNFKAAYEDYRLYKKYSDSIYNVESIKKIQELELKYEFEKEREQLELISKEKESTIKLYVFLFILALVVGAVVGYLIYRNYTARARIVREKLEKEKLKKELLREKVKVSESEIKSLVADNSMRLRFIKELSETIKSDRKEADSKDIIQYTQSLLLRLQQQITTESKLSNIQDRIQDVNRGFDQKIRESYPSLTKTEREVCALLRLNLSIKEIASIRNATPDSVKAIRYRIRKKLQVPSGIELEHFVQSL